MKFSPLFPLKTVLFPGACLPLQIFEPRYLDMIKSCMQQQTGFAVPTISAGTEVKSVKTDFSSVACYCKIIDFDQLPNGLLGVTIEAESRVKISAVDCQQDGLYVAQLNNWPYPPIDVVAQDDIDLFRSILAQLVQHPYSKALLAAGFSLDPLAVDQLCFQLCYLLPIEPSLKQQLLEKEDLLSLVVALKKLIGQLQQD